MWSAFRKQNVQCEKVYFSGKSGGGARPPLFLDQTEARKNVFRPPPALSQGLDDHAPAPPPFFLDQTPPPPSPRHLRVWIRYCI